MFLCMGIPCELRFYVIQIFLVLQLHTSLGCLCSWTFFKYWIRLITTKLFCIKSNIVSRHILRWCSRLCNWLSLRCLVLWICYLPPVSQSTFWKPSCKQPSACKFDTLDNNFHYFHVYIFSHISQYLVNFWYRIISSAFTFTSEIMFFLAKHPCSPLVHRRSLDSFYWVIRVIIFLGPDKPWPCQKWPE